MKDVVGDYLKSTTDSKVKSTAQYQWEALFSDESKDPHFLSKYVKERKVKRKNLRRMPKRRRNTVQGVDNAMPS